MYFDPFFYQNSLLSFKIVTSDPPFGFCGALQQRVWGQGANGGTDLCCLSLLSKLIKSQPCGEHLPLPLSGRPMNLSWDFSQVRGQWTCCRWDVLCGGSCLTAWWIETLVTILSLKRGQTGVGGWKWPWVWPAPKYVKDHPWGPR